MAESGLKRTVGSRESFEKATGGSNPSPSARRNSIMTYEELYTPEKMSDLERIGVWIPAKEDMTCNRCSETETCPFAWDPYNTDSECLASK
jgi:hypothetical protein